MSRSFSIHQSSDGAFIPLPKGVPRQIDETYTAGYIMDFWSEFQELSVRLGVAPIHKFTCDLDVFGEFGEMEEECEEAEEDGDDDSVQRIRARMRSFLPTFQPDQVRKTFNAFRCYIEDHQGEVRAWPGGEDFEDLSQVLLSELQGCELALEEARKAGVSVFVLAS